MRAAILRGAAPAELSAPVQRLRLFWEEVNLPSFPYDPTPYLPGFGRTKPLDYRKFLGGKLPRTARNDLISPALFEEGQRYLNWLSLLQSEARGDRQAIALGQDWLHRSLANATGPQFDLMRRHLPQEKPPDGTARPGAAAEEKARPALITTGEPVAALLASLRVLRTSASEHGPNLEPLIESWQEVQKRAEAKASDRAGQSAQIWMSLALTPEGATLLELRDRAAWASLGHPNHPAGSDVASQWMTQFEAALARGAWEEAERLLTLDRAYAGLRTETSAGCQRASQTLQKAAEFTAQGQIVQARRAYGEMIQEDATPQAGEIAARALKALPKGAKPRGGDAPRLEPLPGVR